MATRSRGKLLIYGILFVLLFFGLIGIFVNTSGTFFDLELAGFVFLLLLAFVGFIGYSKVWGENLFFFTFLFYVVNLGLLWYFNDSLYLVLLLLALLGFLMSIPKKCSCCCGVPPAPLQTEEPHSVVFDSPAAVKAEETVENETVTKTAAKHSPGKFVASSRSNLYHAPKCDWAKKISKTRRVWFENKEEAWEKGYKAHNCAK